MGVVGPSSVADGLPLLHLSPYLSPPLPFSTAVVRLVALQIQVHTYFDFTLNSEYKLIIFGFSKYYYIVLINLEMGLIVC